MEPRRSPVADRLALTAALRSLREASGLSLDEAASRALDASAAKLSRMETGRQTPGPRDVRDLCRLFAVDAERTSHLVSLARSAGQSGWWESYDFDMDDYIGLESAATAAHEFQDAIIPGLLQTRRYAETFMKVVDNASREEPRSAREIQQWLQLREARSAILSPPSEVQLHFIVDEAALLRTREGADPTEQLRHLRELTDLPNVHLRVVPLTAGIHAGLLGGFTVLTMSDDVPDVGYTEGLGGREILSTSHDVDRLRGLYAAISTLAGDEQATQGLLERLIREY